MTEELRLEPEEAVILRMENVGYGNSFPIPFNKNVLILTNRNIILLKKDLFGETTDTVKFPIADIKVVNGQPQVRKGKADHMNGTLDVYFDNRMESFRFEWDSDIEEWIANIVSIVTGEPIKKKTEEDMIKEAMDLLETVEEPIEKFQSILGIKSTKPVACKCPSCGAPLIGIKGETEKCPYCGSSHTF